MYKSRLQEIDELKSKIDDYRQLSENVLNQIKAYFKISFTYSSRGSVEGWYSTFLQFYFRNGFGITKRIFKDYRKVNVSPNC